MCKFSRKYDARVKHKGHAKRDRAHKYSTYSTERRNWVAESALESGCDQVEAQIVLCVKQTQHGGQKAVD